MSPENTCLSFWIPIIFKLTDSYYKQLRNSFDCMFNMWFLILSSFSDCRVSGTPGIKLRQDLPENLCMNILTCCRWLLMKFSSALCPSEFCLLQNMKIWDDENGVNFFLFHMTSRQLTPNYKYVISITLTISPLSVPILEF